MLFLIKFAVVGNRKLDTESINVDSDTLDHLGVIPIRQLRTNGTRVRAIQLFDQQRDGIGGEGHVVMHETEKPAVSLHQIQDTVTRGSKTRIAPQKAHHRCG